MIGAISAAISGIGAAPSPSTVEYLTIAGGGGG